MITNVFWREETGLEITLAGESPQKDEGSGGGAGSANATCRTDGRCVGAAFRARGGLIWAVQFTPAGKVERWTHGKWRRGTDERKTFSWGSARGGGESLSPLDGEAGDNQLAGRARFQRQKTRRVFQKKKPNGGGDRMGGGRG